MTEAAPSATGAAARRAASALVFVADLDSPGLDAEDAHHLVDVLRVGPAEVVVACDGRGSWRPCHLQSSPGSRDHARRRPRGHEAGAATLVPVGPVAHDPAQVRPLTVGFAMTKGDRPEWTVQKLTEIGVDTVLPLLTARTVVRLTAPESARRGERLRRVARDAAAQSRRTRLPDVADPLPFADAVRLLEARQVPIVLAEPGGECLEGSSTTVLVGPEGGWDPSELARAEALLGLGDNVLRAETAAIVCATLLASVRAGALRAPDGGVG